MNRELAPEDALTQLGARSLIGTEAAIRLWWDLPRYAVIPLRIEYDHPVTRGEIALPRRRPRMLVRTTCGIRQKLLGDLLVHLELAVLSLPSRFRPLCLVRAFELVIPRRFLQQV